MCVIYLEIVRKKSPEILMKMAFLPLVLGESLLLYLNMLFLQKYHKNDVCPSQCTIPSTHMIFIYLFAGDANFEHS